MRQRSSSSSSRVRERARGPEPLGLLLGLGSSASAPPSRWILHQRSSGNRDMIPNWRMASAFVMPPSTTAEAAATLCSCAYTACFPSMAGSASLPNAW